jgi:multiple sugar transport system substrate-binding protein
MQPETANLNQGVPQQIPVQQPTQLPPQPPAPVDPGSVYSEKSSKKKIFIIIGVVIAILLILFIAILLLRQKPEEGEAEITYWGLWEDQVVFNEIIQDFERQNPTITVKYEKIDPKNVPGGYLNFVKTRITSNSGPDIFRFHNSWVPQLTTSLAPLPSDVVDEINFKELYYPGINTDMQNKGAYYGIPVGYDSLVMFVNEDIVQAGGYAVPKDWMTFIDVVRALTVVDDQTGEIKTSGTAMGTYDNVAHSADIISLLSLQNGVNANALAGTIGQTPEDRVAQQTASKNKVVGVLDFYTCFAVENDICAPVWNSSLPNSKLVFVQGNLAFYFGYAWDMLEINKANPTLKYSIHPVPYLESRGQGASALSSYWAEGVSVKSDAQEQSFKFLTFLSKKENLEKLYKAQVSQRTVGVPYPRTDMASLLQDNPVLAPVVFQGPNAKSSIFYSDTYGGGTIEAIDRLLGNAIRSVQSGDLSAQSASDTLSAGLQEVFNPSTNEKD